MTDPIRFEPRFLQRFEQEFCGQEGCAEGSEGEWLTYKRFRDFVDLGAKLVALDAGAFSAIAFPARRLNVFGAAGAKVRTFDEGFGESARSAHV